jgi:hypothetical protein
LFIVKGVGLLVGNSGVGRYSQIDSPMEGVYILSHSGINLLQKINSFATIELLSFSYEPNLATMN